MYRSAAVVFVVHAEKIIFLFRLAKIRQTNNLKPRNPTYFQSPSSPFCALHTIPAPRVPSPLSHTRLLVQPITHPPTLFCNYPNFCKYMYHILQLLDSVTPHFITMYTLFCKLTPLPILQLHTPYSVNQPHPNFDNYTFSANLLSIFSLLYPPNFETLPPIWKSGFN